MRQQRDELRMVPMADGRICRRCRVRAFATGEAEQSASAGSSATMSGQFGEAPMLAAPGTRRRVAAGRKRIPFNRVVQEMLSDRVGLLASLSVAVIYGPGRGRRGLHVSTKCSVVSIAISPIVLPQRLRRLGAFHSGRSAGTVRFLIVLEPQS